MAIQPSVCGSPRIVSTDGCPESYIYSCIVSSFQMSVVYGSPSCHPSAVVDAFSSSSNPKPRAVDRRFIKFKYPFNCHPEHKRPAQRTTMTIYSRSHRSVDRVLIPMRSTQTGENGIKIAPTHIHIFPINQPQV